MNKKRELTESEIEELDITLGNNEIVWCEIEYKEDEEYKPYKVSEVLKLPMSSKEDNLKNKSCDYNTLAIMTLYSNANLTNDDEYQRYVYLNKIYKNQEEIEKLKDNMYILFIFSFIAPIIYFIIIVIYFMIIGL